MLMNALRDSNEAGGENTRSRMISVENVTKRYGPSRYPWWHWSRRGQTRPLTLKGVDLTVNRGEIYGILGTNGAGKTTLLRILETLTKPTSGQVRIDGLDVVKHPYAVKRRIGVQIQQGQGGFYQNRSLLDLLAIFAKLYGVRLSLSRRKEMLEFVNLLTHRRKSINELSGGQRQRFAICAALVHNPPLLILDEPTAALDVNERRRVWELLKTLQADGKTILLTTHYMREAEVLCERISILDQGQIAVTGSPGELIEKLRLHDLQVEYGDALTIEDVYVYLTNGGHFA